MVSIGAFLRGFGLALTLAVAVVGGGACGGGGDGSSGTVEEACGRLDECNLLEGMSAGECVEEVDNALDDATSSESNDWETMMDGCLQFDSCANFTNCVVENGL